MNKEDNYPWLDEYCLSFTGTVKDYKEEWDAIRYMIGGKMLAMKGGDKYGKSIVTLKLDPDFGDFLRKEYDDVIPGYYMNKVHWNSLYLQGSVPDEVLKEMIEQSYQLIYVSLNKKTQNGINSQ